MPQAVDLVVKNGAATPIDKTFTMINPSAGLDSIAEWNLKEGAISSVFPVLTTSAKKTPKGKLMRFKLHMPSSYTDTVTGLTNVGSAAESNCTFSVPSDFPEALKADWVAFNLNLMGHALLKAMIRDATPAT